MLPTDIHVNNNKYREEYINVVIIGRLGRMTDARIGLSQP